MWLRSRLLLRLARRLVRSSYRGSRAVSRLRKGTARVDLRASIFCTVRERCRIRCAASTPRRSPRLLALFELSARTEVVACRGTGERTCVLNVAIASGSRPNRPTPEAT